MMMVPVVMNADKATSVMRQSVPALSSMMVQITTTPMPMRSPTSAIRSNISNTCNNPPRNGSTATRAKVFHDQVNSQQTISQQQQSSQQEWPGQQQGENISSNHMAAIFQNQQIMMQTQQRSIQFQQSSQISLPLSPTQLHPQSGIAETASQKQQATAVSNRKAKSSHEQQLQQPEVVPGEKGDGDQAVATATVLVMETLSQDNDNAGGGGAASNDNTLTSMEPTILSTSNHNGLPAGSRSERTENNNT